MVTEHVSKSFSIHSTNKTTENYKTLMKETEDATSKQTDMPHSAFARTLLKCPYYPKLSTESMYSLSKDQQYFSQK